jgi:nitrite reductase/ring-hydroxylating ferredoxin subunit/uncharacterized membrane protein
VLTDVPIGAWTMAFFLDLVEAGRGCSALSRGSDATIGIGVLGALCAASAGLTDWYPLHSKPTRRVGLLHALLNVTATALYASSWIQRKRGKRRSGLNLAFAGSVVATVSAYLGGILVYEQRVGVDHAPRQGLPDTFVPVLPDAELPDNHLRRVEANGVPIVLARRDGVIYALAETCAHMGGPLAEGKLDGDSVICPWHGSRFCLKDGHVLDGPATFSQPCFETRIRNGQIEVKASARDLQLQS